MKLFVVLALAVVAAAQESQYVPGSDRDAEIIRNDFSLDEAGGFVADMETSNSIVQGATGTSIPGAEPETGSYTMSGQYSYVAPDGRTVTVTWTADEGGFSAESDDIPQLAPEHQAAIDGSVGGLPETYSQE